MAKKGNVRHMKTITSPVYFGIHRKETSYVMKTRPGRHSIARSMPIGVFLKREGISGSTAEAKAAVRDREIQVNGRDVTDVKYAVGLGDVITLKKNGAHYVVSVNRYSKATFSKVDAYPKELTYKLVRKYKGRTGKVMFGLHDGSNIEGNNEARVNDSVSIDASRKIRKVLKLDRGAKCLVIDGVHVGTEGTIKDIKEGNMHTMKRVTVESDGSSFETTVGNVMIIQ